MSFTTECEAQAITATNPFTEGFEDITGTHIYSETNGIVPTCWDSYSEGTVYPHIINSGSYYYVHGGTGTLYFKGEASTNSYLALPIFTNDLSTLIVSFWMQTENASSGTLSLGYITNADVNYNTYQVIKTYDNTTTMKQCQTYLGSNTIPSNAARLVFRWQYTGTSWYGACIDDVTVEIAPSYTKTIEAHSSENGGDGWYLIASPLAAEIAPTEVTNLVADPAANYDLYSFDQTASDEWYNYKAHTNGFVLKPGKGYLYANAATVDLTFTGMPYNGNGEVSLDYFTTNANAAMHGWNLIGNPFSTDATVDMASYRMNNGNEFISTAAGRVEAMEGLLVMATGAGQKATFTPASRAANEAMSLALNLSQNSKLIDRAIVSFNEGNMLPKFQLNPNHTKVYIQQDNKDYAVVYSEGNGEMPVNFKAEKNGSYTLAVNMENVEFSYLHLIDNMTGVDVNLLQTPSYSFDAKTTDYESRFRLVFATGNSNEDSFAYFSNGSFVINNEGNATLQVVDVMGRILKSETINGCANINVNAAPGVYMIRLINGDNMKIQKVVVK
jgi:hypothetical protein